MAATDDPWQPGADIPEEPYEEIHIRWSDGYRQILTVPAGTFFKGGNGREGIVTVTAAQRPKRDK